MPHCLCDCVKPMIVSLDSLPRSVLLGRWSYEPHRSPHHSLEKHPSRLHPYPSSSEKTLQGFPLQDMNKNNVMTAALYLNPFFTLYLLHLLGIQLWGCLGSYFTPQLPRRTFTPSSPRFHGVSVASFKNTTGFYRLLLLQSRDGCSPGYDYLQG